MRLVQLLCRALCWLVLFSPGVIIAGRGRHARRETSYDCRLDDDNMNEKLLRCLNRGKKFIRHFFKALGTHDTAYDLCEDSERFLECIEPMRAACPNINHTLHTHWRHVIDYTNCVCVDKKPECKKSLDCFFKEYANPLVGRCDAMHEFNLNQGTRSKCHFLRENINCKDALFTSACGELTGEFAYHAMKLEKDDFIKADGCHIPREPEYKGFKYSDNNNQCNNFLDNLKTCIRDNISRKQTLKFREDNNLVIEGSQKKSEVKEACSRLRVYENCIAPINESCPRGLEQVYEFDMELRHYHLKMKYICGEGKKGYLPNIKCFNVMHEDKSIDICNKNVWQPVNKYLRNVTSHQVYCMPEHSNVLGLNAQLETVGICYEEIANSNCTADGGKTLSNFIKVAFKDPAYLQLDYKADCELHAEPTTTTISTTPATRKTTAHPQMDEKLESQTAPVKSTSKPDPPKSEPIQRSSSVRHRSSVFTLLVTFVYALHCLAS